MRMNLFEAIRTAKNAGYEVRRIDESDMPEVDDAYNFLLENDYFTEQELELVTAGWGYSMNTLDTVCQARYAMDVEQLRDED